MQQIADVLPLPLAQPVPSALAETTHPLEVDQPDLALRIDEKVFRFEVVVPNAQLVEPLPDVGNLPGQVGHQLYRRALKSHQPIERSADDVVGEQIGIALERPNASFQHGPDPRRRDAGRPQIAAILPALCAGEVESDFLTVRSSVPQLWCFQVKMPVGCSTRATVQRSFSCSFSP